MSAWKKIAVVAAAVVLVACLVSPVLYMAMRENSGLPGWMTGHPFHRYFSRTIQVTALAGALLLVFWLGVRRLSDLGLEVGTRFWKDLLAGVGCALVPGAVMAAGLVYFGVFKFRGELEMHAWLRIAATAGAVSIVEELIFRGLLLGLLLRAMRRWAAVVTVSGIFAVVHFLRPTRTVTDTVTWTSGFEQALTVFHAWPPWPQWAWGLGTLFFAGLLLGWTVLRTRTLWLAIGLHAGWILTQQGFNWLAMPVSRYADDILPWYGPRLVSGVVPTGLLPLLALGAAWLLAALCLAKIGKR